MTKSTILIIRAGSLNNQQHITTLCNFLARSGFHVTLASLSMDPVDSWPVDLAGEIKRIIIDWNSSKTATGISSRLTAVKRLRTLLRSTPFDLLYIIDSWTLPFAWLATAGRFRWKDRQLVYHTFDMLEPGVNSNFHLALERKVTRAADLVVNTDQTRAFYQKSLYRLKEAPLYIRNCLPLDVTFPEQNEGLRKELLGAGSPLDAILMVYPTIASSERLTIELIKAFAVLPARYRLLTIVQDNAYGQECRDLVISSGLAGRVTFHPPVTHERIVEFIACADIGAIFHNYTTSFGNFLCNPGRLALFVALGMPFVASAVPNLEIDVYKYGLGFCCNPFDPDDTAKAIRRLVEETPSLDERKLNLKSQFRNVLNYGCSGRPLIDALARVTSECRNEGGIQ